MVGSLLGNRVVRVEDPQMLVGGATYVDDLDLDGLLHLAFVRSTVAHARLLGVDTDAARALPGVVAVFVAADLALVPFHALMALNEACARPPLADGRVRFVGDAVAVVVGTTRSAAVDGAEAVIVDYDPLPAVVDMEEALAPDAALQFDDLGTNLAAGSRDALGEGALEGADVVVRARIENQRVAVVPMEGNAIAVVPGPDGAGHELTIYLSTQNAHGAWRSLAPMFGLTTESVRVIAPHVGGAFGGKAGPNAEHVVAVAVARRLGRPVKWVETRWENMMAMPHGRGQVQYVEMGFTHDGTITGMRCRMVGDAGAYAGFGGALVMGPTRTMAQGVYRIPKVAYDVAVAVTNTTPMGAFRGAGRPEAAAFLERIMDLAADELDIDPVELRRRNLLRAEEFPLTTLMGAAYDSGDYHRALDEVVRLAGYDELRAEQARRRAHGDRVQLGIGVATYVEVTGGAGSSEFGAVEVHTDGRATIRVGTSSHGQGHATSFSMLVSDTLGIPLEAITFVQSDTALVPRGNGTGGSRSLQVGGNAVRQAAGLVLEQGRELAAHLLEASIDDITLGDDGRLGVSGVPTSGLTWAELATAAESPLAIETDFVLSGATFPFGAHIAVVEVDTETGRVTPIRHIAVDDCGRILNPLLVQGQQHGGIAQGIAQALWERVAFDPDGNPLTSTLADYAIPSAAEFPSFEASNTETPSPLNPLGAKGIGESGTIGSTPAVHNAVIDAVSHLGVRHIDMPCTAQRVWEAIRDAADGRAADPWREPPAVFADLPERRSARRPEAADVEI